MPALRWQAVAPAAEEQVKWTAHEDGTYRTIGALTADVVGCTAIISDDDGPLTRKTLCSDEDAQRWASRWMRRMVAQDGMQCVALTAAQVPRAKTRDRIPLDVSGDRFEPGDVVAVHGLGKVRWVATVSEAASKHVTLVGMRRVRPAYPVPYAQTLGVFDSVQIRGRV